MFQTLREGVSNLWQKYRRSLDWRGRPSHPHPSDSSTMVNHWWAATTTEICPLVTALNYRRFELAHRVNVFMFEAALFVFWSYLCLTKPGEFWTGMLDWTRREIIELLPDRHRQLIMFSENESCISMYIKIQLLFLTLVDWVLITPELYQNNIILFWLSLMCNTHVKTLSEVICFCISAIFLI